MKYATDAQLNYQHYRSFCAFVSNIGYVSESKLFSVWYKSPAKQVWNSPTKETNPWDNMTAGKLAYHCLHHLSVRESVIVLAAWYVKNGREKAAVDHFQDIKAKVEHVRHKKRFYFDEREGLKRHENRMRSQEIRNREREEAGRLPRLKAIQVYRALPESHNAVGDDLNDWSYNEERTGTVQGLMTKFNVTKKSIEAHLSRLVTDNLVRRNSDGIFYRQNESIRWDQVYGWTTQEQLRDFLKPYSK
jgi:hypothetical protein